MVVWVKWGRCSRIHFARQTTQTGAKNELHCRLVWTSNKGLIDTGILNVSILPFSSVSMLIAPNSYGPVASLQRQIVIDRFPGTSSDQKTFRVRPHGEPIPMWIRPRTATESTSGYRGRASEIPYRWKLLMRNGSAAWQVKHETHLCCKNSPALHHRCSAHVHPMHWPLLVFYLTLWRA